VPNHVRREPEDSRRVARCEEVHAP
jgi:hypothetical protein